MKENLKLTGKWLFEIKDTITGKTRTIEQYNLIPAVGKQAFAVQLAGDNTTQIGDNLYIALGDSATAPASGDTTLGNETTRKAVGSTNASGGVSNIAVFFASGEATGTHKEFGLFGDGNTSTASSTSGSGILFSHVSTSVTVSSTETLTCTFTITFT